MNHPKKHFRQTKNLLKKVSKAEISGWLLKEGYYPEQYVVPPPFRIKQFKLQKKPFYNVDIAGSIQKFEPVRSEIITVSYPKTQLTDKTFGIIEPQIYHDLVWYIMREWDLVINHIFNPENEIYAYSFPIPVTKKHEGDLSDLRAGRMIYEFIEMAEKDLVAEAHKYKFLLKTDIKNFYPSIYTHSIAWALHTKHVIRTKGNKANFSSFLGLKIDKLLQSANDGVTNGIPIGPAISDLISEILLAGIDKECSMELKKKDVDFMAVRFKDDYRFLCNSKEDAQIIIKTLQSKMKQYNLNLNDNKTSITELPEGLFREWTSEYQKVSLKYKSSITYKIFENTLLSTLKIDKAYPDTGVIDIFLSELTTKKYNLKIRGNVKAYCKILSMLLLLKERRTKSFPQVLAIIEKILSDFKSKKLFVDYLQITIQDILIRKLMDESNNLYDILWLVYFVESLKLFTIKYPKKIQSPLLKSLKNNKKTYFNSSSSKVELFEHIKGKGKNIVLLEYLAIYKP